MQVIPGLAGLAAVVVVAWAQREARAAARHVGERRVVEYPIGLRVLSIAAFVGMVAFAWVALPSFLSGAGAHGAGAMIMAGGIILMVLFPIPVALDYFGSRIYFDSHGIEEFSLWRSCGVVQWKDIERVVPGYYRWTVVTNGHGTIGFNTLQRGWRELRTRLEESAPHRG